MLRNRIEALKRDRLKIPNREHDVKFGLLYQQHDTGQMTSRMQKWGRCNLMQPTKWGKPTKQGLPETNTISRDGNSGMYKDFFWTLGTFFIQWSRLFMTFPHLSMSFPMIEPDQDSFHDEHSWWIVFPWVFPWVFPIRSTWLQLGCNNPPGPADTAGCLRGMSWSRMLACPQKSENKLSFSLMLKLNSYSWE